MGSSHALLALPLLGVAPAPATVEELEAALNAQDSATAALEQWCAVHQLATNPAIHASIVSTRAHNPPDDLHRTLRLDPGLRTGFRHVRLSCGDKVLSVAYNWYVPTRLTAEMNHRLGTSNTPFGKVAAPLRFTRERLGGDRGAAPYCPPGTVLSQRALLRLPDGTPLAYLVECYTAATLGR